MKRSALKYGILSATAAIITLTLLLIPFHAFLTVWLASNFGHYTAIRLWKEVLLALASLGTLYLVIFDKKTRLNTLYHELSWLIIAYAALQLIEGAWAYHHGSVSLKAVGYGLLLNLRFLLFFLCAWVVGSRTKRLAEQWSKLLVWPAVVVIAVGLLQAFVLPHDFLKYFGYSAQTIMPTETINHNSMYIRIMSTLRGANPLGAYLLLPISGLLVLMSIGKRNWRRSLTLAAAAIVLFFSFSRAAWIGVVLSVLAVVFLQPNQWFRRRYLAAGLAVILLVGTALTIGLWHNSRFQNIVFHTEEHSKVAVSSNAGHESAFRLGIKDAVHEPLGRGPGTAGPASVYNTGHSTRISENYFLQLAQEVGWAGLILFLSINGFVGWLLWQRRADPLALTLLASLVGVSFINLLSHAWTDDTLAYLWWGLAGIAIGTATKEKAENAEPNETRS